MRRRWLPILAVILAATAVGMEVGMHFLGPIPAVDSNGLKGAVDEVRGGDDDFPDVDYKQLADDRDDAPGSPGLAIPALALIDSLILCIYLGLAFLTGRVRSVVTAIVALLVLIFAIIMALTAFALVMVMIGLFLAVPFGTIAYIVIWGFFSRGTAAAVLGGIIILQIAAAVCATLNNRSFLQNKTMVLLLLTSLGCNVLTAFLHGLVPMILVSIVDAILAIVIAIVAAIWALNYLIRNIIAAITQ